MSVQRYSINWVWQEEETDYEGEWVKYEDCKTLESELQAAKDRIRKLESNGVEALQARIKALECMDLSDAYCHKHGHSNRVEEAVCSFRFQIADRDKRIKALEDGIRKHREAESRSYADGDLYRLIK